VGAGKVESLFSVRVFPDNLGDDHLIGQLRRLADEFGKPGIEAKRGEFNSVVRRRGYLCLRWKNRRLAKEYQEAVARYWGDRATTRRFRRRKKSS
jgi:hypothetical protein